MQSVRYLVSCLALSTASIATAQEFTAKEIREEATVFAGVLEAALDLDNATGLFGMNSGGVDTTYIRGQGMVINVRTPLANRRNTLSLASLNTAMQSLQARGNPLESIRRNADSAAQVSSLALTESAAAADDFYQQMMDRIAGVDYSLVLNTAVQQASESLRSLRSLGDLDEQDYARLRNELDSMRASVEQGLAEMNSLQADIGEPAGDESSSKDEMLAQAENLLARLEPLREQALAKARELKARTEEAEQRHSEQWFADVAEFETRLYATVCDYSASLRFLPATESLAIVLERLGADAEDNSPMNRIHVISQANLQSCQRGAISAAELQQQSVSYNY